MTDLHSGRCTTKTQDHWAAITEWKERHDVPAPEKLWGRPEVDSVRF